MRWPLWMRHRRVRKNLTHQSPLWHFANSHSVGYNVYCSGNKTFFISFYLFSCAFLSGYGFFILLCITIKTIIGALQKNLNIKNQWFKKTFHLDLSWWWGQYVLIWYSPLNIKHEELKKKDPFHWKRKISKNFFSSHKTKKPK